MKKSKSLTLDIEVIAEIEKKAKRSGRSFSSEVNFRLKRDMRLK